MTPTILMIPLTDVLTIGLGATLGLFVGYLLGKARK